MFPILHQGLLAAQMSKHTHDIRRPAAWDLDSHHMVVLAIVVGVAFLILFAPLQSRTTFQEDDALLTRICIRTVSSQSSGLG